MKYLVVAFLFLSQLSLAEDKVQLALGYQDSSNYRITQESTSEMKMDFFGDKEASSIELQSQLPMHIKAKQEALQLIETGIPQQDGSYSVSMVIKKNKTYSSINGAEYVEQPTGTSRLEGATINGVVHSDGKMDYKSASGPRVTDEMKTTLQSVFDQLTSSNQLAGKSVAIGETVPLKLPMSIPVGNMGAVNFEMEVSYTLSGIENSIANFELDYSVIVSSDLESASISIKGTGTGLMTYDIVNKISPTVISEMKLNLLVPVQGGFLDLSSTNSSNIQTVLAENLTKP